MSQCLMSVEDASLGAALNGDALLVNGDAPALRIGNVGVDLVHGGSSSVDNQCAPFLVESDFLRHRDDIILRFRYCGNSE